MLRIEKQCETTPVTLCNSLALHPDLAAMQQILSAAKEKKGTLWDQGTYK